MKNDIIIYSYLVYIYQYACIFLLFILFVLVVICFVLCFVFE